MIMSAASTSDPDELVQHVRSRLPFRARLVGEERIRDMVLLAVAAWPIDDLLSGDSWKDDRKQAILDATQADVSRMYAALHGEARSGSVLLAIILPALLSAVIQVILKWWLEKRNRRTKMALWQHALKGGGR